MKKVVIASNNKYKVAEIKSALNFEGWEFFTLGELGIVSEPEETESTFEGNARIKAQAAHEAAGYASLADDSGLAVDYLDGAPGVYSSRYSGEDGDDSGNNAKLFDELEGVPDEKRTARFVCALVFIDEDGSEVTARGTIEGRIGHKLRGTEGFGYDPLFLPEKFKGKKTLAEVGQAEKNTISHRGNALRELKQKIEAKR